MGREIAAEAARLHQAAIVWDTHAGFSPFSDLDLSFLDRWRRAGASYLGINVGYDVVMPWEETLRCTAHFRRWIELHPDRFLMAERVEDIHRAKAEGRLAIAFDLEGANALDGNIEMIALYYRLGVRHMNFAYNKNNLFGGGCHDVDIHLTPLGRRAVEEMNRVGMMVDCSHTGYTTSMDIMQDSRKPVIFSHSNPRALCDHGRNIRDDQIRACAATGGVIGINGVSTYLGGNEVSVARICAHIDYVADLVGIEHVGIGFDSVLDQDELPKLVQRFPDAWPGYSVADMVAMRTAQPEQLPQLTAAMVDRGYSEAQVRAVLGQNFLRVATANWQ
jgi:membrane dipeptidase